MRLILRFLGTDAASASRAAAIVHSIAPGPLARAFAIAAILYAELILFAVAMGGGQ